MKIDHRARRRALLTSAAAPAIALALMATGVHAQESARTFAIAPQPLADALLQLSRQADIDIVASTDLTRGRVAPKVAGEMTTADAMSALLAGSGLVASPSGAGYVITRASDPQSGSAAGDGADSGTVQALIVTAQKREENIQDVPIAMSAFTQEALERSQVAGGPDLMTQVPNMTFTKTNFSSYSIQLRGIGTQAISATTDPAVAVAFNNTPFVRNRFFEQEFYDLQRVEVLRGPQGTLYGRNATAGVVNIISQKPKFTYEAKLSADLANYNSLRLEGMINLPLVEDKVALRLAGARTKREGYSLNAITGNPIDGRDLWSTRLSLRVQPTDRIDVNLIWEHFQEDDDRLRSGKQLCRQDARSEIGGYYVPPVNGYSALFSQGCLPASLYSPDAFQAPNGLSLPYYLPLSALSLPVVPGFNPYASLVQSPDLRVIESTVDPSYKAKSDLVELQFSADLTDGLTLSSESAYSTDSIFSTQDFNRFNTASGAFQNTWDYRPGVIEPGPNGGIFCDPQVGCADRVVAVDLSTARSRQFSQELRLASDFDGPFNFSLGGNFLRYDTEDKYYVFINTLTMFSAGYLGFGGPYTQPWHAGDDNSWCLFNGLQQPDPTKVYSVVNCKYIDPNPIGSLNDLGHNYFLSKNPYKLISYAMFGEAYYNVTDKLKVTAGLRWTVDKKEAPRVPSWLLSEYTAGYPVMEVIRQEWREPTGRLTVDWKPDLSFTDETLLYASFSHGYKAGGANPPPPGPVIYGQSDFGEAVLRELVTKPKIFAPEFLDSYELGSKNTLLDGRLTLNAAAFYYDYKDYQISQIIDRSAVNYNFDAKVWGLELETDWRPLENLRFGLKLGYESTRVADGERAIDIMDRTAGHNDWVVVRPFPTQPSNCILPLDTMLQLSGQNWQLGVLPNVYTMGNPGPCESAYLFHFDPATNLPYVPNPTVGEGVDMANYHPGYAGWDPTLDYGNNNGEGFFKDLSGNELPNAPHYTATLTADYTLPLPKAWLATFHTDLYYQSEAWTRIFNTPGYDKLKAYTNVNFAAIFTNEDAGWKVMAYVKNVFDRDSITGAFLNSDDTGLTTNVFLTEPRLYGLRMTKDFDGGPWWTGANSAHPAGEPYPLTVELSGMVQRQDAPYETVNPAFTDAFSAALNPTQAQHRDLDWGDGREGRVTYQPTASWSVSGALRYGRTNGGGPNIHLEERAGPDRCVFPASNPNAVICGLSYVRPVRALNWSDTSVRDHEEHEVAEFAIGRDLGIGLARTSQSKISGGLRYAHFKSTTATSIDGIPNWDVPDGAAYYASTYNRYSAELTADREFKGLGPVLAWDGAWRLWGDDAAGTLNVDLNLTGGVLFGKQKTAVTGTEDAGSFDSKYFAVRYAAAAPTSEPTVHVDMSRTNSVSAPLLDMSLGLSYEVGRIKIGSGYRWERYYNVLDGGYAEHKSYDRTFDGPYFKIAIGFGG